MDPPLFLPYPNGLPQESKLATYMQNRTTTQGRSLNQALSKLSLDASPSTVKKVLLDDCVPAYFNPIGPVTLLTEIQNNPSSTLTLPMPGAPVHQENVGGTTYFFTNSDSLASAGINEASVNLGGDQCLGSGVLGPSSIQQQYSSQLYQDTSHLSNLTHKPDLPENVEIYAELIPLENIMQHSISSSYRVTHRQTGCLYAMRRLHSYSGCNGKRHLEMWKKIDHPNIVKLHEVFTTKAFNDHSMVFVYEYYPGSVTLMSKYLSGLTQSLDCNGAAYHDPFSSDPDAPRPYSHQKNAMLRAVACGALLPEALLWSLLVQLTAALRTIHSAGLACRSLDPSKVIIDGNSRARIAWCGTAEAMQPTGLVSMPNEVAQAQQEDLCALGRLALGLACRSLHCDNLQAGMELVSRTYSSDLKNLILYLLSTSSGRRSVTDLMPMIGARFYTQVEALQRRADVLEDQLCKESDNGRLLKILIKLGTVNERPEMNMDPSWSETGDRYMLKLFRDHLFHAVSADGRPWLDQGHLLYCLNQLDAGTNNKVQLMSRDEQSVLVVSYAELKHCLEAAFEEVTEASGGQA